MRDATLMFVCLNGNLRRMRRAVMAFFGSLRLAYQSTARELEGALFVLLGFNLLACLTGHIKVMAS